jgi:hypothetical protein
MAGDLSCFGDETARSTGPVKTSERGHQRGAGGIAGSIIHATWIEMKVQAGMAGFKWRCQQSI